MSPRNRGCVANVQADARRGAVKGQDNAPRRQRSGPERAGPVKRVRFIGEEGALKLPFARRAALRLGVTSGARPVRQHIFQLQRVLLALPGLLGSRFERDFADQVIQIVVGHQLTRLG